MTINSSALSGADLNASCRQRFELKCGKPDQNGCIPWLGGRTRRGYGQLRFGEGRTTAHRIAWVLERGDIPPEILVLHRCDNPSCVNVEHLFLGSPNANTADMMTKKRHPLAVGKAPWQKMTAEDWERVRDIRCDSRYTQQEVASYFGVTDGLISLWENGGV